MYRLDWIERLKLRSAQGTRLRDIRHVDPVVWRLGYTSFLTDISSEMVYSILPVYLFLHLRLSPMQYGAIDGVYNGLAVMLVTLVAATAADTTGRHKLVALTGYGLSAVCKLMVLAAGGAWGALMAIFALDRIGKGIRSTPRDAMISLHSPATLMASSFAVHRSLDAGGALLGPLLAFALLSAAPGAFDLIWVASFLIGVLGVAVLWLFVPARLPAPTVASAKITRPPVRRALSRRLVVLAVVAFLFAVATISDGFLYLLLQDKSGTHYGYVPLFYVATAGVYMLMSIPFGAFADRFGRATIFLAGYAVLGLLYAVLLTSESISVAIQGACLLMLGLYYAGTEGVLMAMASLAVPAPWRAVGLAVVASAIALGKLVSSLLFGWLWSAHGVSFAIGVFAGLLILVMVVAVTVLASRFTSEKASDA